MPYPYSTIEERRSRLREIMTALGYDTHAVAACLDRNAGTVELWLYSSRQTIPGHSLELLEYKTGIHASGRKSAAA